MFDRKRIQSNVECLDDLKKGIEGGEVCVACTQKGGK
jgi:hypothetical protein